MLHTHLYGFHVLFPSTVVHEPPYQTYSSVWCAGFRRRFPRMNDRTDSTLVWGSLRLAPISSICDTFKGIQHMYTRSCRYAHTHVHTHTVTPLLLHNMLLLKLIKAFKGNHK